MLHLFPLHMQLLGAHYPPLSCHLQDRLDTTIEPPLMIVLGQWNSMCASSPPLAELSNGSSRPFKLCMCALFFLSSIAAPREREHVHSLNELERPLGGAQVKCPVRPANTRTEGPVVFAERPPTVASEMEGGAAFVTEHMELHRGFLENDAEIYRTKAKTALWTLEPI